MKLARHFLAAAVFCGFLTPTLADEDKIHRAHGLSLFGAVKYGPDFKHFDYVNPNAPKGGRIVLSSMANFDSLNPFIPKGNSAPYLGLLYDSLTSISLDEASSAYGLIAKEISYPADWSWVEFTLRPEARWHDGTSITAEDVVFSFNTLVEKGEPTYRFYYGNVTEAKVLNDHKVRFEFDESGNRELPHIMGQLVILPKHYWETRDFTKTTLEPPLTSGPYRIKEVIPGRGIEYERVKNYWGADLQVNRGHNNFDEIAIEIFFDQESQFQAFKAGNIDFRSENSAKRWATGYEFDALKTGKLIKQVVPDKSAQPMQGFIFNLRRENFQDRRVRAALAYAFDFEWTNENLFFGLYSRTRSYFQSSELAATGLPNDAELKILEPFRDQLTAEVFTEEYNPPTTEGVSFRRNLRKAQKLLAEAGWTVRNGALVGSDGKPFEIGIMLLKGQNFGRIVGPFIDNLKRLGIDASAREVDTAQYQRRYDTKDFDMMIQVFAQSLSPGNEQRDLWGSAAADRERTRNTIGIQDPVVDQLIERLIFATDRQDLIAATRALDRVLQWGHYLIPNWYFDGNRIAHWDKFGHREELPPYSVGFPSIWWYDAAKAARLATN